MIEVLGKERRQILSDEMLGLSVEVFGVGMVAEGDRAVGRKTDDEFRLLFHDIPVHVLRGLQLLFGFEQRQSLSDHSGDAHERGEVRLRRKNSLRHVFKGDDSTQTSLRHYRKARQGTELHGFKLLPELARASGKRFRIGIIKGLVVSYIVDPPGTGCNSHVLHTVLQRRNSGSEPFMGFADCIGGELEKVRPVRAAFLSEQFESLFGDRVEFASGLAEGVVGDDLRGELLSSRPLGEQLVRPHPVRIVPSEGMHLEQLSLRREKTLDIPVDDVRVSVGKRKRKPVGTGRSVGGESGDFFHDGGDSLRGNFFTERAAEKRVSVRFERAAERLVDEGQRGVGKKRADKVGA